MNVGKIVSCQNSISKRRIPRFIYHLTSKKNYNKMLKDGFIKTNEDDMCGKNIFAIELRNFFKRWRTGTEWDNDLLQDCLLRTACKEGSEVVMLKIPTRKLNLDKLKIRSQNKLLYWYNSDEVIEKIRKIAMDRFSNKKRIPSRKEFVKEFLNVSFEMAEPHLKYGEPAQFGKLFKQRKHAIEYFYPDKIKMTDVEKIGEVNIEAIKDAANYDSSKPIRSAFCELLKGKPEVKGAELLNC